MSKNKKNNDIHRHERPTENGTGVTLDHAGRVIVVGDVHGCLSELLGLLNKVGFKQNDSEDLLVLAGDLVDRGNASDRVVSFARSLSNAVCVMGNHDNKYVRYQAHENKKILNPDYRNPMRLSPDKDAVWRSLGSDDIEYLCKLPSSVFLSKYDMMVVHAGLLPAHSKRLAECKNALDEYKVFSGQRVETHIMARYLGPTSDGNGYRMVSLPSDFSQPEGTKHWSELYNGRHLRVCYGHHVHSTKDVHVTLGSNENVFTMGLDTGCCFGGRLSALVLDDETPNGRVVGVDASRKYINRAAN